MTKGLKYYIEDDKIREYMKLSTEEKLKWLDEIQKFSELAMTEKDKEIREKFRKREI
ncbi:MAG: hypothetical protein V1779_03525 [bacterium]